MGHNYIVEPLTLQFFETNFVDIDDTAHDIKGIKSHVQNLHYRQ